MSQPQHVFISYSTKDRAFVERLKKDFESAGVDFWIDQTGLKVGTDDWEQAIRAAIRDSKKIILVASPDSRESRYVRDELLIAEMYKRPVIAIWANGDEWANCVRMGFIGTQYADARGRRYKSALMELIGVLHQADPTPPSPAEPALTPSNFTPRNPYKGLRAFTGDDKDDYFGRESLIAELVDALKANIDTSRFLAVVGPSGSGKSSIVMAGLLPSLQDGALPGSDKWVYLDPILPGAQPLESLAVVLSDALDTSISSVLDDLDHSARGLHLLARRLAKTRDSRVVLLVDQFEELFTQTADVDKRNHFIDLLVTAATEPGGQTIVLITLRADFYDRPMNYPELGKLLEQRTKSVLPMSIEDLRAVIEKPAALPDVQLEFEPGLVGDLLFEVRGQPGALPLLQFTLDQLVEKRQGRLLTNASYHELGGVKGALAKHAEATYQNLPSDLHREMARALFLRLIEPGATEQDTTRRRADQSELITTAPEKTEILRQVANAFTDARLLVISVINDAPTIEVSHEALIREWERLAGWITTARDDVRLQQIISRDAQEWIRHGKRTDNLYPGIKLQEANEWIMRNIASIQEIEFIETGLQVERERIRTLEAQVIALQEKTDTLDRQARRLQALNRAAHVITANLALYETLQNILHSAMEVVEGQGASLFLFNRDNGDELIVLAAVGLASEVMMGLSVRVGQGVAGWVAREAKSQLVGDMSQDPRFYRQGDEQVEMSTQSLIAVPLITAGRVIGVVEVVNKLNNGVFTVEDVQVLEGMAGTAAVSIVNARLFDETQRRVNELGILMNASAAASSTLQFNQVLQSIAQKLADGLQVARCTIMAWNASKNQLESLAEVCDIVWTEANAPKRSLAREPLIRASLTSGLPIIASISDPNLSADDRVGLQTLGMVGMLAVPLWIQGVIGGIINLYTTDPMAAYTEIDVNHVNLVLEAWQSAQSNGGNFATADEGALKSLVSRLMMMIGQTRWVTLRLWTPGNEYTSVIYEKGFAEWTQRPGVALPIEQYPTMNKVIQKADIFMGTVEDFAQDRAEVEWASYRGGRSSLVVPLLERGNAIGVVKLLDQNERLFDEGEVGLAQGIAHILSGVIQNVNTSKFLENKIESLEKENTELKNALNPDEKLF